jgi:hypothetical protein
VKRYFTPASVNEIGESYRYCEIGDANQRVRDDVTPHQGTASQIAIEVRQIAGREDALPKPGPREKKREQD